jgi:hypothetical protein
MLSGGKILRPLPLVNGRQELRVVLEELLRRLLPREGVLCHPQPALNIDIWSPDVLESQDVRVG